MPGISEQSSARRVDRRGHSYGSDTADAKANAAQVASALESLRGPDQSSFRAVIMSVRDPDNSGSPPRRCAPAGGQPGPRSRDQRGRAPASCDYDFNRSVLRRCEMLCADGPFRRPRAHRARYCDGPLGGSEFLLRFRNDGGTQMSRMTPMNSRMWVPAVVAAAMLTWPLPLAAQDMDYTALEKTFGEP